MELMLLSLKNNLFNFRNYQEFRRIENYLYQKKRQNKVEVFYRKISNLYNIFNNKNLRSINVENNSFKKFFFSKAKWSTFKKKTQLRKKLNKFDLL